MTGVTLTTAIPGPIEGLLAGTALAKATPPASANAAAVTPTLPNGFADLLALLGVSAQTPEVSETETHPTAPIEVPDETPTAVVAAPPEQIASAIIRAMLKESTPRPDVAPNKLSAKDLPNKTEAPSAPALTWIVPAPAPTATVEKSPDERPDQPTITEPVLTAALDLVPTPGKAIPTIPAPIEVATPAPAAPPTAATPIEEPLRIAAPVPNIPSTPNAPRDLPREIPPSIEIPPTAKQAPAAPLAFALRLTVAEDVPARPARTEAPIKTKPIEAAKLTPEVKSEDVPQPTVTVASGTDDADEKEQTFKDLAFDEKSRPEKTAHSEPRIAAAPLPEPQPGPAAAPAPQRESVKLAPTLPLDTQPRATDVAPVLQAPVLQAEEAPKPTQAAHEIAVRVSAPDASPVDLHVTQRGTEVRVAVRTADEQMQSSLRQDLSKLVDRLEQTGFHAESLPVRESTPAHADRITIDAGPVFAAHGSTAISGDSRSETSSQQDGREGDTDPNQSGSRQQQQHQRRQQRQPKEAWEDFA